MSDFLTRIGQQPWETTIFIIGSVILFSLFIAGIIYGRKWFFPTSKITYQDFRLYRVIAGMKRAELYELAKLVDRKLEDDIGEYKAAKARVERKKRAIDEFGRGEEPNKMDDESDEADETCRLV